MSRPASAGVVAALASVRLRRAGRGLALALASSGGERRSPGPAERLRDLAEFEACFEELVDTLLDAARFGCGPSAEERYRAARARALAVYPRLRPVLGAYLPAEPPARRFGGGADSFERLFLPSSVADVLAGHEGALGETVERTREAIAGYARHLRALMGNP
ncbi:MAG: hypothetical protein ACK41F_08670 [Fimbriimonadaceae bacterium]